MITISPTELIPARARVFKVRTVQGGEIIIVEEPNDVLDLAEDLARALHHQLFAEAHLVRDVLSVGEQPEIDGAGHVSLSVVALIHLENEPGGVSEQQGVIGDAQGGRKLLQGVVVTGV